MFNLIIVFTIGMLFGMLFGMLINKIAVFVYNKIPSQPITEKLIKLLKEL